MQFLSAALLSHWGRWEARVDELRVFEHRILVPNIFTRRPSYLAPFPLHPSDWAYFGTRADLERLFDVPLMTLERRRRAPESAEGSASCYCWSRTCRAYTPEQWIWVQALRRAQPDVALEHAFDLTPRDTAADRALVRQQPRDPRHLLPVRRLVPEVPVGEPALQRPHALPARPVAGAVRAPLRRRRQRRRRPRRPARACGRPRRHARAGGRAAARGRAVRRAAAETVSSARASAATAPPAARPAGCSTAACASWHASTCPRPPGRPRAPRRLAARPPASSTGTLALTQTGGPMGRPPRSVPRWGICGAEPSSSDACCPSGRQDEPAYVGLKL